MTRFRRILARLFPVPYDPWTDPTICGEVTTDPCNHNQAMFCRLSPMHDGPHVAYTKHGIPIIWVYTMMVDGQKQTYIHLRQKAIHD